MINTESILKGNKNKLNTAAASENFLKFSPLILADHYNALLTGPG